MTRGADEDLIKMNRHMNVVKFCSQNEGKCEELFAKYLDECKQGKNSTWGNAICGAEATAKLSNYVESKK